MNVLKAAYNAGNLVHKSGIELAPNAIEAAVSTVYSSESGLEPQFTFVEVPVDNGNITESHSAMEAAVTDSCIILGGDHSITASTFKGFAKGKENPGLLVFDAHPDLMEPFQTHEDYLRTLIEEGIVAPENVILVGIRNSYVHETAYIKEKNIKVFSMKKLEEEGKENVCDALMELTRDWSNLYVSVDIDVLDPAFAPGTGYCEPGGLSTRELLYFIHRLKNLNHWTVTDIVEVNPEKDVDGKTVAAAAKLLVEIAF